MSPIVDDKKYAKDPRPYGATAVQQGWVPHFDESPVSQMLTLGDICYYAPGDLNKIGKEGRTSWDSFSYALLMAHNVWTHLEAVQRANREYDSGTWPAMMWNQGTKGRTGDHARFKDIVDAIFAANTREESEAIIEHYSKYWMDIVGTRGFKGEKTVNARSQFSALFDIVDNIQSDSVQSVDGEFTAEQQAKLDQLTQEQQ
jgi:hypothetical protein